MKYLKDLIIIETRFHYDREGRIIEEKKLAGSDPLGTSERNKTLDAIIREIKLDTEKKRKWDKERKPTVGAAIQTNQGYRMSKRSMHGNPDSQFQFLQQVIRKKDIRFEHPSLQYNTFPTSVRLDTKLIKVHYLFQMLGTSWIFVRGEKELLKGFITKQGFLSLRYSLQTGN